MMSIQSEGPAVTRITDLLSDRASAKCKALIVQGGGMRGVYSMGALAQLDEAGFREAFDVILGASAGAINAAYFLAGQASEAVGLYANHLSNRDFLNPRRLGKIVNVDYLIDTALKVRLPLNIAALKASRTRLEVVLADAVTGEARIVTNREVDVDFYEVMRATAALPGLYNRKVLVGDRYYVDGSSVDGFPVVRAIEEGANFVVAISTRVSGYRKEGNSVLYRLAAQAFARGQSREIRRRIGIPDIRYNRGVDVLEGKLSDRGILSFGVYPSDPALLVGRTTSQRGKLLACAEMGRKDMCAALVSEVR
jgi:predicted patatin/cPLA2 family phospholipase